MDFRWTVYTALAASFANAATAGDLPPVGIVRHSLAASSGVLVGPCEVLTSRHGILARTIKGQEVSFTVRHGAEKLRSKGRVVLTGQNDWSEPASTADYHRDWVLLRLNRCLGRQLGYFQLPAEQPSIRSGTPVMAFGFGGPSDGTRLPSACHIRTSIAALLYSDCRSFAGDSGGAIYRRIQGGYCLVGLITRQASKNREQNYAAQFGGSIRAESISAQIAKSNYEGLTGWRSSSGSCHAAKAPIPAALAIAGNNATKGAKAGL